MSEFDFGKFKKKKVVANEATSPSSPSRKPKSAQIDEKKLAMSISKQVIETLTETFQMNIIKAELDDVKGKLGDVSEQRDEYKQQLNRFIYNKDNLLLAIYRRVHVKQEWNRKRRPKGIKADNLMPRFGEQVTRTQIQIDLVNLRSDGILKKNKDGWYNFTPKGIDLIKSLISSEL